MKQISVSYPVPPPPPCCISKQLIKSLEKNLDSLAASSLSSSSGSSGEGGNVHIDVDTEEGTYCQVLNLIDPSLYPYIPNISPTISDDTHFLKEYQEEIFSSRAPSLDHSWIPTDFIIDEYRCVTISGYINGLDDQSGDNCSQHSELYSDIAFMFQSMIPKFEAEFGFDLVSTTLQVVVKAVYNLFPPDIHGSFHRDGLPHEHISVVGLNCLSISDEIKGGSHKIREIVEPNSDEDEDYGYKIGDNRLEEWVGDHFILENNKTFVW
eukprot:CAMPEP_0114342548 /NCGR_PEP_ID=MMETSP0101-20121206/9887_1 /TAXON_ID=38822 ORGANISM="Pteridomonas danica, Strain PT" /NCGR_SAMPLE_ID=MMETSP0101 /ASSEMBLY_ACC=CAM_ASM_000211 /LENGTH=265 /DNA_ID=CAMNT_0001476721 /DNA_START=303 /DNA_END=1097 /DNA_ORIENTATION=-